MPKLLTRTRSQTYKLARLLGDVQAVLSGRFGQRVYNRLFGKHVLWRLWRKL